MKRYSVFIEKKTGETFLKEHTDGAYVKWSDTLHLESIINNLRADVIKQTKLKNRYLDEVRYQTTLIKGLHNRLNMVFGDDDIPGHRG